MKFIYIPKLTRKGKDVDFMLKILSIYFMFPRDCSVLFISKGLTDMLLKTFQIINLTINVQIRILILDLTKIL